MVKYNVEFELPALTEEDDGFVMEQITTVVNQLRVMIAAYKKQGFKVPTITVRGIKTTPKESDEFTVFKKELIEHFLEHMPKGNVGTQMSAIKSLYATGTPSKDLIAAYNASRKEYAMTTWNTVKYKYNKEATVAESTEFVRKPMTDEEKQAIIDRAGRAVVKHVVEYDGKL